MLTKSEANMCRMTGTDPRAFEKHKAELRRSSMAVGGSNDGRTALGAPPAKGTPGEAIPEELLEEASEIFTKILVALGSAVAGGNAKQGIATATRDAEQLLRDFVTKAQVPGK